MKLLILSLPLQLITSLAFAGVCVITTSRVACPGKETEMLKPYDGQDPTEETRELDSLKQCLSYADKSSKIIRRGTLRQKFVRVRYENKKIAQTFSDKSDCL